MRIPMLVLFEIAVIFGIPRAANELRAALAEPRPVVLAVSPVKDNGSVSAVPAKAVLAKEVETAQLQKIVLPPSARSLADLQPIPAAPVPAKESPVQEKAAISQDDDYLPPWMRGERAAKRDASLAASLQAPEARKTAGAARQATHKRRHGGDARAGNSRRSWRAGFALAGF